MKYPYDAMTSDRSYRKGLPHSVAVAEIQRCANTQFDPMVVDIFLKKQKFFEEVRNASNTDEAFDDYAVIVSQDTKVNT